MTDYSMNEPNSWLKHNPLKVPFLIGLSLWGVIWSILEEIIPFPW